MPRQNPYQMDPYLAQGFSSLTKALIGDPETDYQVARTNRVNELLPLEKQQMQAQIGGSNASAAAARALETLRQAQTLTENQLRDPRVQTELANATATLALAGQRDANSALIGSQQATEEALLTPRVDKTKAEGDAATALGQSRLADAMLTGSQQATEEALLTPRVDKTKAEGDAATALGQSRLADAMLTGPAGTGKVKSVSASATKFLVDTIETELNLSELEIPRSIRMEVRGDAANFIQENGNTEAAATFIANALKPVVITEQNLFRLGLPISGFSTAQYVLDQIEAVKEAAQNPSAVPGAILTMLTTDYGYSEDQAKAIMAYANI